MGRVNADIPTDLCCRYFCRKRVDEHFDLATVGWDQAVSRVDDYLFEALRQVRRPESFGRWGGKSGKDLGLVSESREKEKFVMTSKIETYRLQCDIDQCWVVEISIFNLVGEPGRCGRGDTINSAHRVKPLKQILIL